MATGQQCMDYAHECMRLAGLTDEPEIRDQLFALARETSARAASAGSATHSSSDAPSTRAIGIRSGPHWARYTIRASDAAHRMTASESPSAFKGRDRAVFQFHPQVLLRSRLCPVFLRYEVFH
jgi:hypothetical protein